LKHLVEENCVKLNIEEQKWTTFLLGSGSGIDGVEVEGLKDMGKNQH